MSRLPKPLCWGVCVPSRLLVYLWVGTVAVALAVAGVAFAQSPSGKSPPSLSTAGSPPASAGGVGPADPALAKTLCGLLKKVNARAGTDPAALRLDLVMASGKAVEYDPAKFKFTKTEIDKLTSALCPLDRELALANLQVKSLAQAIK